MLCCCFDIDGCMSELSIEQLVFAACRGGWPASLDNICNAAKLLIARDYVDVICNEDVSRVDKRQRNPTLARLILRSYARNLCTMAKKTNMLADVSVPQREFTLIIKAYTHNIIRVFTSFDGSEPVDQDDMMCWHKKIRPIELSVNEDAGFYWMVDGNGEVRATLNCAEPVIEFWSDLQPAPQPTLDLKLYPEGAKSEDIAEGTAKSVNLSAYDHFSPRVMMPFPWHLSSVVASLQLPR
jgi:hypothetical protein